MKSSYLRIGGECTVGNASVVLYDTHMQQGSKLAPLSLLMKGETLPPFSDWAGIPIGSRRRYSGEIQELDGALGGFGGESSGRRVVTQQNGTPPSGHLSGVARRS